MLVQGDVASLMEFHGPDRFGANSSVPYAQLKMRLLDDLWIEKTNGGLMDTATEPGVEVKPPIVTVTA